MLNGAKLWISNSPECQVAVVWAKNEQGRIKGVIVERGMAGFTTPEIHNKWSLRASITGELVFDNVIIPKENILPNVDGLKGPLSLPRLGPLRHRLGGHRRGHRLLRVGPEILAPARAVRQAHRGFQLTQAKLSWMAADLYRSQLLALHLGRRKEAGSVKPGAGQHR